jgi:hypothetical protein
MQEIIINFIHTLNFFASFSLAVKVVDPLTYVIAT